MRVRLCSDMHTEMWERDRDYCSPGAGDVLIMAGDIGLAADIANPDSMYRRFLQEAAENYNKVFYTIGNHESYHYDFKLAESHIRRHLPDGITLLNNQSVVHDGVHFVGATMWADFKNANPLQKQTAQDCMNDYRVINYGDRMLTTDDTLAEHDNTVTWLRQCLPMLRKLPVVVYTHHCPSFSSLRGRYATGVPGAYATDLTKLVETYQPALWCHGHCHYSADYTIGSTRVVSNPRGYAPYELNSEFSMDKSFDV